MGIFHTYFHMVSRRKNSHLFRTYFHMTYNKKNSHPIFHMHFSHDRTTLFFSHYFFTCSFESVLISHTKKEVHMYVKLQFCV